MLKTISRTVSIQTTAIDVMDTIRSGDSDAYVFELTFYDVTTITGTVQLHFALGDGTFADRDASDGVVLVDNKITYTLEEVLYSVAGLVCYVQFIDSNLYTPLKVAFIGIAVVPGGTSTASLVSYPAWVTGIESAEALRAAEVIAARGGYADLDGRLDNHDAKLTQIAHQYGNRYVMALRNVLNKADEPAVILITGDSTSNDSDEWFYLMMQDIATEYPQYSVAIRTWSDTTQSYSGVGYDLGTGSNGDGYGLFTSAVLSTTDKVSLRITGDIDICAKIASNNYKGAGQQTIISKFGNYGGVRGYQFRILATSGKLFFYWSNDGTTLLSATSTVAPTVDNGSDIWVRATLDVDNGSGGYTAKFYTSANGFTWTQLGDSIIGGATTTIFACEDVMYIGSQYGTGNYFDGKIYKVFIKNGIDGSVVASPDFGLAFPSIVTTFNDAESNVWTIVSGVTIGNGSPTILALNGSTAGKTIAYSADETRFALQVAIEPQLVFVNYGHNEGTNITYQSAYEAFCSQFLTKWPNIGVVCVTQNPEISPATNIKQHEMRNTQIAIAAAKNNYGLIDAFTAFVKSADITQLINAADGIHPTSAGSDLWKDEALKFMMPLFY